MSRALADERRAADQLGYLRAHPAATAPRKPRRKRLTERQVRKVIAVGQVWEDPQGRRWLVINLHRKDRQAQLRDGHGDTIRVKFADLGRDYTPSES